jgi:hypothetical protein
MDKQQKLKELKSKYNWSLYTLIMCSTCIGGGVGLNNISLTLAGVGLLLFSKEIIFKNVNDYNNATK